MGKMFWNLASPFYAKAMKPDETMYQHLCALICEDVKDCDVLELATGPGMIARGIATEAKSVVATDYSQGMIDQAQKTGAPDNVRFEVADAMDLQYPEDAFDVVIIANALHLLPESDKALACIEKVLKDDGLLIAPNFVDQHKNSLWARFLKLIGVGFEHQWTKDAYVEFLTSGGWHVERLDVLEARLPLVYVTLRKEEEH